MAPVPRQLDPPPGEALRESAVLIPLFLRQGEITVLLIERQQHLSYHAGEIGFPGGGREPQDATLIETALREAQEEIGIASAGIEILGELTPLYIPPSRHFVHPYVGWLNGTAQVRGNPGEVNAILEVPLCALVQPDAMRRQTWIRNGRTLMVPFFEYQQHQIWGATAMILSEMLALIRQSSKDSLS